MSDRHVITESGDSLTVFRMDRLVCLARGRQDPQETIQMSPQQALDLAGRLMDEADFEETLREAK